MAVLEAESPSLLVLSLFRCASLQSLALRAPALATLFLSQSPAPANQLRDWLAVFPSSLRHLFLSELPGWDFALLPQVCFLRFCAFGSLTSVQSKLFASLPALRYLNLYRSGHEGSTHVVVKNAPALVDLSLEGCPFVQSVTVDTATCPLLKRVILCRGWLLFCSCCRFFFLSSISSSIACMRRTRCKVLCRI